MRHILILALVIFSAGCDPARMQSPNQKINADKEIEIFDSKSPDRPYREMGRVSVSRSTSTSDKLYDDIRAKARRAGADAVIIKSTSSGGGLGFLVAGSTTLDGILIEWK